MDETSATRAVHHVYDCATGIATVTELTDAELADQKAADAADAKRAVQEAADEQALRVAVAAHPDPIVKALAARLGLA